MCTVLLPQGVNPIAVNKYININILWRYLRLFRNSMLIHSLSFLVIYLNCIRLYCS